MSTVQSFIDNNNIGSTPTQVGDLFYYSDDRGNLFVSNRGDYYGDFLIGIPSEYSGDLSLVTYSNGSGWAIPMDENYTYNPSWSPSNSSLSQQAFCDYLMNNNSDSVVMVTRYDWDGSGGRNVTASIKSAFESLQSPNGLNLDISHMTFSGFSDGGLGAVEIANAVGAGCDDGRLVFFDTIIYQKVK